MFVLFDLPVVEKEDRKAATDFRNYLLDDGFQMVQFSTYVRLLSGKEALPHYVNSIKANLPECILRSVTVGSAEQNGRDAERAVAYLTA